MSILVEIAGQPTIEFPDGTDPKVIDAVVKRDFIKQQPVSQPEEKSGFSEFVTGAKRGLAGLAGGIGQRLGAFSQQDVDMALKGMSEERQGEGFAGTAGEFVGSVAPTFLIPGGGARTVAGKVIGSALQGGTIGALQPTKTGESVTKNIGMGLATGGGTTALLAGASKAAPAIGRLAKETLGTTTGAGGGSVSEAIKGGQAFKKALRGEISGEDVVENAKGALQRIKDKRAADYQVKLANIPNKQVDMAPIDEHLNKLLKDYNIKKIPTVTGKVDLDMSRVAMGKSGKKDIQDVIEVFADWGSKADDTTALGLDTLKRQLSDFYSDSSQARQFVASLNKKIDETIKKNVPEYADMTKGYSEATKLIKDIESGLMMRKTGLSGRVVADQTLRRLTSAMRESFELRKDLVEILSKEGGADVAGEIAGYSMSQSVPKGLFGKQLFYGGSGLSLAINPWFLPVFATGSPRVVGEFLLLFGKAQREIAKQATKAGSVIPKNIISKTAAVQATKPEE